MIDYAREPVLEIPSDFLSMPADEYASLFNVAAGWRSYLSEGLLQIKNEVARIESSKSCIRAQLRQDATFSQREITKRDLEDEIVLDPSYQKHCCDQLCKEEERRKLEASLEKVEVFLRGWSRVVEVRRQELFMNPPTIAHRGSHAR